MKGCRIEVAVEGDLSEDGELKGGNLFASTAAREPADIAENFCALGVVSP